MVTNHANKALVMPLLAHRFQHIALDRLVAPFAPRLVQVDVALLAVRKAFVHDKRFSDRSRGRLVAFALSWLAQGFRVDERVAAFRAEEVELVVEALAQGLVV